LYQAETLRVTRCLLKLVKYTNAMSLFRRLLLVFLVAWLPLQGWAAVAMPFCKHGLGHSSGAQTAGSDDERQLQRVHAHHDHDSGDTPTNAGHGLSCNDCGACHLACSSSLVSAAIVIGVPAVLRNYRLPPVPSLYLFYPEQPNRPPLNAIA
jgi:hypothetical protein